MKTYSNFNEMFKSNINPSSTHSVFNEVKVISGDVPQDFDYFYGGSYFTFVGVADDLNELADGIDFLFEENGIGKPKGYVTFTGKDMNEKYGLRGSVAYPDDLTFFAFPLDGLDVGRLSVWKIKVGARWFDDIVDNNRWNMMHS